MSDNLAGILEKVSRLLALSKSSNANEAAAAAGRAAEIMDKYRLTMADLESPSIPAEAFVKDSGAPIYETGRTVLWKTNLVYVLCNHYGVAYYYDLARSTEMGRKYTEVRLVGKPSGIEMVRYMFAWLSAEIQRISDTEHKGKGFKFTYIFSYCEGFVAGIEAQLKVSRATAKAESSVSSVALAKIDNAFEEANAWMKSAMKLSDGKGGSSRQFNAGGFASGKLKGENLHLGSSLNGGKVKMLGN